MRSNLIILLLACALAITTYAQDNPAPSINIGDPAPALQLRAWLKGKPIRQFERGKTYVLEFWATWCRPCIASLPHLSAIAREYKDKVTIMAIDIHEKRTTPIAKIKAFVDSMGQRMDFVVASEDSDFMENGWLKSTGGTGIPATIVVNEEGRLAWIGYPTQLDTVLPKIVNHTWDIRTALAKRTLRRYLDNLDDSLGYEMANYTIDPKKEDSVLIVIDQITSREPRLKYMPRIGLVTFRALLKKDPSAAYRFGKEFLAASTLDEPTDYLIFSNVEEFSNNPNLPKEIYRLGAEAYQVKIDRSPFPELLDLPDIYHKMAALYYRAGDR
ncbi:MAG TPA: TlpA disulfide reductase family protein, partial [Puia sp.]|nr:TlpA disulfide reductase family protein [Puia sp.]